MGIFSTQKNINLSYLIDMTRKQRAIVKVLPPPKSPPLLAIAVAAARSTSVHLSC
jgi:hypothetical protein